MCPRRTSVAVLSRPSFTPSWAPSAAAWGRRSSSVRAGSAWAASRVSEDVCEGGSQAATAIRATQPVRALARLPRRHSTRAPRDGGAYGTPRDAGDRTLCDQRRRPSRHPRPPRLGPGAASWVAEVVRRRLSTAASRKKRLRLLLLIPFVPLPCISTVFGTTTAVAKDFLDLECAEELQTGRNATLVDRRGQLVGRILMSDRDWCPCPERRDSRSSCAT